MRVMVLFFGVLKDLVGCDRRPVELADGAKVQDLLDLCQTDASNQSEIWTRLAVAVNREYGTRGQVLHEDDEVALLPPVSGGRCA